MPVEGQSKWRLSMAPLNENKILFESPMRQNNTSSVRWRGKCPPDKLWFGGIIFIIISWCETFCDTPSTSRHFTLGVHIIPHRTWETELCHPHHHSTHYVVITLTLRDGRHTRHRSSACYIILVPHTRHVHIRRLQADREAVSLVINNAWNTERDWDWGKLCASGEAEKERKIEFGKDRWGFDKIKWISIL